jgi:hypothetical protein
MYEMDALPPLPSATVEAIAALVAHVVPDALRRGTGDARYLLYAQYGDWYVQLV